MHLMFSFSNIVFKHPAALIYHLLHIYFRLKCNLLITLLPHTCFCRIQLSSGVFYLAKIVALYVKNFVSRMNVIFPD
jgi:hypothetical protein